ncbi:hypothetical protein HK104_003244, partial [Borealophlyctis nickersoniae]
MANSTDRVSSTSDDLNTSVNSDGKRVMSANVWSWSRFTTAIKQGRFPVSLMLVMFIVPLSAGVAILSWGLTYTAALSSASTLANSLQEQILARIVSEVSFRIKTLERSADQQSRNWHDGYFSKATNADKEKVVDILLNTLAPNADWYTSQHFTLFPEGECWGINAYPLGPNGTYLYMPMYAYGENWTFWLSDEDGNNLAMTSSGIYNNSDIDKTDPKSAAWTPVFVAEGVGYQTHTHAIFQGGKFIGVQGADFTLDFVQDLLMKLAAAIPYRGYIYTFELSNTSDLMIGSSLDVREYDIYERNNGTAIRALTLPELAANVSGWESLHVLYDHLLQNNPTGSLLQYISQPNRPAVLELHLSDGVYLVQMTDVSSLNLHWGIIHFVQRDDILAELTKSNRKIVGTVAGVVVAGIIASVAFSYSLSRALHKITRDLMLLSDFQFKDVLQKDLDKRSGMARPSFSRIAEL